MTLGKSTVPLAISAALLLLGPGVALAQRPTTPLQAAPKTEPFDACCSHCSSVVCSGCTSNPTGVCTGKGIKANCTMVSDVTKCVPARKTALPRPKLKGN